MTAYFQPKSQHQVGSSFPVRRMDFDFGNINKYFIENDPVCSALWTAFQAYFPEGEQFFVDSVRDIRAQVTDSQLQKDVAAFIGQEAMHAKEHYAANEAFKALGIDVSGLDNATRKVRLTGNRILPKRFRVALTAAAEHFTGVISEQIANREDFKVSIVDDRVKSLILWHAMEETEHRAVVFDLYTHTGGGYTLRAIAMTVVALGISPVVFMAMVSCLRQDKQLLNVTSWKKFIRNYWGRNGFFTEIIPDLLSYYKPSFHPNSRSPEHVLRIFRNDLGI
ncbi:MAG: metal-dependent hydrolase [Paraperlucidibaca sp.]